MGRLTRNFHKTFQPERQYLHAMLHFASSGGSGDVRNIAEKTGIPTGVSSGKVAPTLDYCQGMGLITTSEERSAVKTPALTPFGRVVFLEDRYLKEAITQWLAHFHLCDAQTGAEVWHQTFCNGRARLGMEFSRDSLEDWLASACAAPRGGLIGPMVRMYEDQAAFQACGVLTETGAIIRRVAAPIHDFLGQGYGAWILSLMESVRKAGEQVTVAELEEKANWRVIAGWNVPEAQRVLEIVERKGLLTVDRHMTPWILRARSSATNAWGSIYNDLI